ncbi:MAG: hypothetical protein ACI9F2_000522 [Lysobacterales bacterium]|jgi:hypothetical protein
MIIKNNKVRVIIYLVAIIGVALLFNNYEFIKLIEPRFTPGCLIGILTMGIFIEIGLSFRDKKIR